MLEGIEMPVEPEEKGEKQPRKNTHTDPESMQSMQKEQMKSIFLSVSDEEDVKKHKELYDKTHAKFKDKQRKEGLWKTGAASRNLSVSTVKKWFETQQTINGKLKLTKLDQAAAKNTERHTLLMDSFNFL